MKSIVLSLVAVVFAVNSFAQDGEKGKKTPEEVSNKRADKLKTELSLSDDQRSKAYAIILDSEIKSRAIKAKYPNDEKAAKSELKPLRDQTDLQIKGILTPEQLPKWEAMKKEHKEKSKENKGKKKEKKSEDSKD